MEQKNTLTLGSLFDGSGGFPLGGLLAGIAPVWASEIEPVDIITFGSPCTDMSIAGKRAGLDGAQSSLFYQAIRIIKEMRCATHGRYPRWICWENVIGAFSSNQGRDFKAVLEAVIGLIEPGAEVPMPEKSRWPYADIYMGERWSVAYRTVDAQHWGVPQRRRRVYLVGDLAGQCAGQVLFESEGLSGYSAEGFRSWQRAARDPSAGLGAAGGICLNDQGGGRMDVSEEVTATLRAQEHGHPPCVLAAGFCKECSAQSRGIGYEEERAPTLRAGAIPAAVALESHPMDGRIKIDESGSVQTLTSRMGTGGMNVPLLLKIRSGCEGGGKGPLIQEDVSATLSCNNDQTLFVPFCKGTRPHSAQESQAWKEAAIANTLNTFDVGESRCNELAVRAFGISAYTSKAMLSNNPHAGIYEAATSRTLDQSGGNPACNQGGIAVVGEPTYAMTPNTFTQIDKEKTPTLAARDYKGPTFVNSGYYVRRLTPTECARLQGFPDWWCAGLETPEPTEADITFWTEVWETHRRVVGGSTKPKTRNQIIKWLKDPHSDAAEYKMWGNGVALPNVFFVLAGIVWSTQFSAR